MADRPRTIQELTVYCRVCGWKYEPTPEEIAAMTEYYEPPTLVEGEILLKKVCRNPECKHEVFFNPLPVSVALVRCGNGILGVRRNIDPKKGELSLPGGFHNYGESWEEALVRELREETGVVIAAAEVKIFRAATGLGKHQLAFGYVDTKLDALPPFDPVACHETQELVLLDGSQPLCFPTHDATLRLYLEHLRVHAELDAEMLRLRELLRPGSY
jgi:ADP-ribose pyrophosphatase YjhB (NUDIX family)